MFALFTTPAAGLFITALAQGIPVQRSTPNTPPAATVADARTSFEQVRNAYLAKFKPLFVESATAWWVANTTGSDDAFKRKEAAENALVELHSDKATFARLEALKREGSTLDPLAARELDVMYRTFKGGQADAELQKRIVALETQVEKTFNAHRSPVGGKELTENDVRQVLSESDDSSDCREAWEGYMQVGAKVDPDLRKLVELRNQVARQLGFKNFYVMRLTLEEVDEAELFKLFDELDALTAKPYAQLMDKIKTERAGHFKIKPEALRPWHFADLFFQAPPPSSGPDLDEVYRKQDLLELTKRYYTGLGLEVDDILQRSDLYEKPGKSPHAFSTCLDRDQDVRVLCNLKNNLFWADTLIHELGHAVYDKYIARDVPFLIHEPAHSITTEGYAMMMGAMVKSEDFLANVVRLPSDQLARYAPAARESLRAEKLIFSRWAQVMVRFEHGMYSNPNQDLGKLWWDLKRKYQLLPAPETVSRPDYAAKIHVVTAPAYYHSYMLGDLFACQVHAYIARHVLNVSDPSRTCFAGKPEAGMYMKQRLFGPGDLYPWNELTRRATGEPMTAKYFAEQYVGS